MNSRSFYLASLAAALFLALARLQGLLLEAPLLNQMLLGAGAFTW